MLTVIELMRYFLLTMGQSHCLQMYIYLYTIHKFSECIDALEIIMVINVHNYQHIIIGEDFNTDLSRNKA